MKITDRLIGDHKTFRKLIKDLDEIAAQPEKRRPVKRLMRMIQSLTPIKTVPHSSSSTTTW